MDYDDILDDDKPELNITPLVDIMLVLLAILMITTPSIVFKEDIKLPDGSKTAKAGPTKSISIRVDSKKNIYVNDKVFKYENFKQNFSTYFKDYNKEDSVYIYGDKGILYGEVIAILAELKNLGFTKVSLGTK